jgi:hypothetical protein
MDKMFTFSYLPATLSRPPASSGYKTAGIFNFSSRKSKRRVPPHECPVPAHSWVSYALVSP